jgi:hypothetical protein
VHVACNVISCMQKEKNLVVMHMYDRSMCILPSLYVCGCVCYQFVFNSHMPTVNVLVKL